MNWGRTKAALVDSDTSRIPMWQAEMDKTSETTLAARKRMHELVQSVEGKKLLQALADMQEIVTGIRRVTDIMGEISAASAEQSAGVGQVGEAVTQMDQATQQNAALVEEMAAAAGAVFMA